MQRAWHFLERFLASAQNHLSPHVILGIVKIEETLYANGVKYIQGINLQFVPTGTFGNYRKKYHFLGQTNSHGQYFLIRNCFFEPSLSKTIGSGWRMS